jgi:hypothetical protein
MVKEKNDSAKSEKETKKVVKKAPAKEPKTASAKGDKSRQ